MINAARHRCKPDADRGAPANGPAAMNRLRDHIDRGGSADKVAAIDPAAAPLGTDAEAAGTPPTPDEVAMAREAEAHRASPARNPRKPASQSHVAMGSRGRLAMVAAAIALVSVFSALGGIS